MKALVTFHKYTNFTCSDREYSTPSALGGVSNIFQLIDALQLSLTHFIGSVSSRSRHLFIVKKLTVDDLLIIEQPTESVTMCCDIMEHFAAKEKDVAYVVLCLLDV